MNLNTLQTFSLSSTPLFHTNIPLPDNSITFPYSCRLKPPRRSTLLRRRRHDPNFKVRSLMREGQFLEAKEAELLLATCITRILPPALTLRHGLDKIKDAVQDLKSKPPCSTSGMYRFQVAVSPGARALSWFCCQATSSGVFPQLFVSTEVDDPTYKSLSLSRTRGFFGIGAAVYFKGSYSCASQEITFKRYHSVDSTFVMAYGLLGTKFNIVSSSVPYETGSLYILIPQIELVELDGLSILAATLAWSDSSLCAFEEAVQCMIYLCSRPDMIYGPLQRNTPINASVLL